MNRSKFLILCLAMGWLVPTAMSGETLGDSIALAPPGPCAEPRDTVLRADPVYQTASGGDGRNGPDFVIAGDPVLHFDPVDVAGEPPRRQSARPTPNEFPAPCSTPDAGCVNLLGGITEQPSEPSLPPGVGGNQQ